jgi:P27 family predicted phage terminase small subunit
MKGRLPKPETAKRLQGDSRQRGRHKSRTTAQTPDKPKDFFSSAPTWAAPAWLSKSAQAVWNREIDTARRQARLQESHLPVFGQYCDAIARVERYSRAIQNRGACYVTPSGYRRLSPEVGLRNQAAAEVKALAAELMLTPKSWVSGMGTFSGRQLEMFLDRPAPTTTPATEEPATSAADAGLGSYIARRPSVH